ncbi:TonB-dependent receptor plug domain-containing protein [Paucibacter sp. DJ2R-2]|uniref:TonB-dependent receptor plug domain-containing protein n=1 Tax=Paucibacter sp. DJ2R-2 TaxID=2893558 RepID=UPI0021E4A082|nr:TonB-dependent receptor [Paucibacter sp. DJ2R-2]MCV2419714.1 TonB-dependent receptor [Paucibacter sp. DJ4R-1]MCV2437383.1 TonB-dependent receptor [Paucibacter sp. DJ2R-2]
MPQHLHLHQPALTCLARALRLALGAATCLGLGQQALAQEDGTKLMRVEITGTSIKRLDAETALPVQVINREAIEKSGVTTAEQLLGQLAANVGAIEEKAQNTDTQKNSGFSGANLRGLGVSSTLVLLNGRRMANYAFGGQGVDLSSIPLAALERVEVLKDGASATYGADAVGGVINFITRKDYQGAQISGRLGGYDEGGGKRKQLSASAGYGDLVRDGYNVFGALQAQKSAQLRASQREWAKTALRPDVGSVGTSTTNFPANLFTTSAASSLIGSVDTNGGKCSPPTSVFSGGFCNFDYQATADLVPEASKVNGFARGVVALNANNFLFAEAAHSTNEAEYRISPATFTSYRLTATGPRISLTYPKNGPFFPKTYTSLTGQVLPTPNTKDIFVSVRLLPLGQRERVQETTQSRYVFGAEGEIAGWDYSAAFNHSVSKATEQYNNGFVYGNKLGPLITSGVVNLWGDNTPEVMEQLRATQANHVAGRTGRAVSDSISGHASKEVYQLPAGALALAAGFELRREKLTDIQSDEAKSGLLNNITSSPDTRAERKVKAVFAEVHMPIAKGLDADLAVRHDRYDSGDIGNSTNPKFSLRWQPVKAFLLRSSVGTGFRAPSLADVSASGGLSSSSNFYSDPLRCVNGVGPGCKPGPIPIRSGGNPFLKPETSKQASLGAAFEPGMGVLATVDYWRIQKDDVISQLSESLIGSNFAYISRYVTRDPADPAYPGLPGQISEILLPVDNQGVRRISGLDLALTHRGNLGAYGRLRSSISGTLLLKSEEQLVKGGEVSDVLGKYANLYPTPRWKHQISIDWSLGAWNVVAVNQFQSHYRDAFASMPAAADGFVASVAHGTAGSTSKNVASHSTYNLQGSYTGLKNLRLTAGVTNLFNKAPPTSNQSGYFRGFDQSVDATGRFGYVSATYTLK